MGVRVPSGVHMMRGQVDDLAPSSCDALTGDSILEFANANSQARRRRAGFRVPSGVEEALDLLIQGLFYTGVNARSLRQQTRPCAPAQAVPFGRAEKHSQRMQHTMGQPPKLLEERYKPRCFANRTRCLGKAQTRTRPAGAHSSPALGAGMFTESRRLLGAALCTPASD